MEAADDPSLQLSLFGAGRPAGDPAFAGLRRHALDRTSWVDLTPGWLTGSDTLFATLVAAVPWQQRSRVVYDRSHLEPRLTAGYPVPGAPAPLDGLAELLSARYGVRFDSLWANFYRDGRDSVAWHRDRVHRLLAEPLVAIVSLGTPRRFGLRPRAGGPARWFSVAGGDLLVMGGRSQQDWDHTVPKAARGGARISVTYRHAVPAGEDLGLGPGLGPPPGERCS